MLLNLRLPGLDRLKIMHGSPDFPRLDNRAECQRKSLAANGERLSRSEEVPDAFDFMRRDADDPPIYQQGASCFAFRPVQNAPHDS